MHYLKIMSESTEMKACFLFVSYISIQIDWL